MNKRRLLIAVLTFIISLIIVVGLLSAQLFWIYRDEILNKDLDGTIIIKFILTVSLSLLAVSIPISIILSTSIYFRLFFKSCAAASFKNTLLFSLLISSLMFFWDAFATPKFNNSAYKQLYSIRMTESGKEIYNYVDKTPTKSPMECNILELNEMVDSLRKELDFTVQHKSEMPESIQSDLESLLIYKARDFEYARGRMVGLPIFLFVLIYLGVMIGLFNRNNHPFVFFAGLYFFLLPLVYSLYYYFLKLSENSKISTFEGQFYPIIILSSITVTFYIVAKKNMKLKIWS